MLRVGLLKRMDTPNGYSGMERNKILAVSRQSNPVDEERRLRILGAAEKCFLKDGFDGCSVDTIATEASVSKREIYRTWPTKSGLFKAVIQEVFRESRVLQDGQFQTDIKDHADDATVGLAKLAERTLSGFLTEGTRSFFGVGITVARQFPNLAREAHAIRTTSWPVYSQALREILSVRRHVAVDLPELAIRFGSLAVDGSRYLLDTELPSKQTRKAWALAIADLFLHGYGSGVEARRQTGTGVAHTPHPKVDAPELGQVAEVRLPPEKIEAVLNASLAEFLAKGFQRASPALVAATAKVGKATVYRLFGSKEGLFQYVIQHRIRQISQTPYPPLRYGQTLKESLAVAMRQVLDKHVDSGMLGLQRVMIEEAERFSDLARTLHKVEVSLAGLHLQELLTRHGKPPADEVAIRAFYTLATYGTRFLLVPDAPDARVRIMLSREAANIFAHGITELNE